MSRYTLNKAMWEIDLTDTNLETFKADPAGFLDDFEGAAGDPHPPYPRGGSLTGEERRALETLDFGALYAMGVSPFLLWQFARSVVVPDLMTTDDLIASFREQTESHGSPDFAT